jgi:hypothetical protein
MPIKATYNDKIPTPQQKTAIFPLLAAHTEKDSTFVVLFSSETEGTVVASNDRANPIGKILDSWISVYKSNIWTILPENFTLCITQE